MTDKKDKRVDYFHQAVTQMNAALVTHGSALRTYYGRPLEIFNMLADEFDVQHVFCNRDYEPFAIQRDIALYAFLKDRNISFQAFKDQAIFDRYAIVKQDGSPYTVYTPYSKKWKANVKPEIYKAFETDFSGFCQQSSQEIIPLSKIGFEKTDIVFEIPKLNPSIIDDYDKYRDYPALQKTTQLGIALRFGTISIRQCVAFALDHNQTWLAELIWREFFMQILYHFPHVEHTAFKKQYDLIPWRNNEEEFEKWCNGQTGYPLVDAGMRQLKATGFMHNRVRMVVAGFLCKHLLIDWRWGEAYFAQKLNDYDLAANNGNWQWAAGSGCDSAPYFRVFNPTVQMEKFDKHLDYVKTWVPEFGTTSYPETIVDHSFAKERALRVYREALNS